MSARRAERLNGCPGLGCELAPVADLRVKASAVMNISEPYAKEKIGSHLSYPLNYSPAKEAIEYDPV